MIELSNIPTHYFDSASKLIFFMKEYNYTTIINEITGMEYHLEDIDDSFNYLVVLHPRIKNERKKAILEEKKSITDEDKEDFKKLIKFINK